MKTGSTKKALTKVLAASMAFSLVFASGCIGDKIPFLSGCFGKDSEAKKEADFIDSIGGVSETYTGAVSEQSYENAEVAAKAFVEEEVVGETDCEIENVESKGTLSDAEVSQLNLTDDIKNGMTSVEKLEVEYVKDNGTAYMSAAPDTLNKTQKVTVYVIKYESRFKYYSPAPITGNTITKSYYDSIFNAEKYKNCTYKTTMEMEMDLSASYQGQSQSAEMTMGMSQLIQYSENKIYMEQTISYKMSGMGENMVEEETICAYMEVVEGEIVCYVKTGDSTEWYEGSLSTIGFDDLDELTPFYDQYLDYSYFTKTDYGFEISDENAKQFIEETLSDSLGAMDMDEMLDMFSIDMFAKYYVSQGVLSGMREDVTMKLDMNEEGMKMKMSADVVAEMSCTNYGTTVVTKPFTE